MNNIIHYLRTGFSRSVKSWKGIALIWILYLILSAILSVPFSSVLKRAFGNSMITDELRDGLNIEVLAEQGSNLSAILSFVSPGLLFVLLIGFVLTAFLNGGLFDSLRGGAGKFSVSEFFSAGARNFWTFLLIAFLIRLIIIFMGIIFVAIPLAQLIMGNGNSGGTAVVVFLVTFFIYLVMLPVVLLAADYARAARVADDNLKDLKALGYGFSRAFRKFRESYTLMLILFALQVFFLLLVINTIPFWKPQTGSGVFLLFLASQFLLFMRLALRTWQYASVTASGEPYIMKNKPANSLPEIV